MTTDPLDGTDEEIDAAINAASGEEKTALMWRVIALERSSNASHERSYRAVRNTLDAMAALLKTHRDIMEANGITPPDYEMPVLH
jgi:hypothetical protein